MNKCLILSDIYSRKSTIVGNTYEECILAWIRYLKEFNYRIEGLIREGCSHNGKVIREYYFSTDTAFTALRNRMIEKDNSYDKELTTTKIVDFDEQFIKDWCKRYTITYNNEKFVDYNKNNTILHRTILATSKNGTYTSFDIVVPAEYEFDATNFNNEDGLKYLEYSIHSIIVTQESCAAI